MNDKTGRPTRANEGIQANNVTAEVIAVGRRAVAYKGSGQNSKKLAKAVDEFKAAIDALQLQPHTKASISKDLKDISAAHPRQPVPEEAGHALENIASKLKAAGVVLSEAVALSEPARKIAELLQIPLHMLGL